MRAVSSHMDVAPDVPCAGRQLQSRAPAWPQGGVSQSSDNPIPVGGSQHPVVAGFFGSNDGEEHARTSSSGYTSSIPSSVEPPQQRPMGDFFTSSADTSDVSTSPGSSVGVHGAGFGGEASGGTGGAEGSSSTRRQSVVDDLLRESVLMFHREGPLVNPMQGPPVHAITGLHENNNNSSNTLHSSSMKDKMQFVAEVKGFEYGIFWGYMEDKKSLVGQGSIRIDGGGGASNTSLAQSANALTLYIQSSMTMFATWHMGFGIAGRVGHMHNYEWHEDVTSLPSWSFQRLRQAKNAGLRTVIAVPVAGGVVEFGGSRLHPHNVATVTYVQKVMGTPA